MNNAVPAFVSAIKEIVLKPFRNLRARYRDEVNRRALSEAGIPGLDGNDFNNLLHHLRGRELMQLPKGARRFISVGCAGTWYFNWIEACCGPIGLHTGIEFYSPKPDDLR